MQVQLYCGDEAFKGSFEKGLESISISVSDDALLYLLVDRPLGWASLDHPDVNHRRCIVMSDNLCPTYRLNLLARKPAALVTLQGGKKGGEALLEIIKMVLEGNVLYPRVESPLTPVEQQTVCLVALGLSNKAIATKRNVTERTIKNTLSGCYKKLNLKSRVQLALYYYGHWHLISGWTPPESIHS